jgi:yeast amino acid transporter
MADIKQEKYLSEVPGEKVAAVDEAQRGSIDDELPSDNADHLQRRLGNRQIQLIAIGGSIGTAVFVSINSGLARGGPGSLLLAYTIYSCFLGLINNCMAEMTVLHPVSGGFIRMAGHWVDDAFGFMAGWNVSIPPTLLSTTQY